MSQVITYTLQEYAPIFRTSPDACNDINNNLLLGDKPQEIANTYVLHNAKNFYGVGILAYPGMLDKIAELLEDDFYFYAKNSIYSTITPCNENYDGLLLKAPVNWNPMTCKECAFSPYVHKYDRKSKKIETVYYVNK